MAYTECPVCGGYVSLSEKTCVLCGAPLMPTGDVLRIEIDSTVRVFGARNEEINASLRFTFWNEENGRVLATAHRGETVIIPLSKPTKIRCHLAHGWWEDAMLDYYPRGIQTYRLGAVDTFFHGSKLLISRLEDESGTDK